MTAEEEEGVYLFLCCSSQAVPFNLCKVQADADPVWDFEVLLKRVRQRKKLVCRTDALEKDRSSLGAPNRCF